jgi:uncharacterized Tic20 family protein
MTELPSDAPNAPRPEPARPVIEVTAEVTQVPSGSRVYDIPPSTPPPTPPPPIGGGSVPPIPPVAPPPPMPNGSSSAWAMACHLAGLLDLGFNFAFAGLIGSLVIWLVKKDEDPEVDFHGKEAVNFQISLIFWWIAGAILCCCLIGIPILLALPIVKIVLMIYAAVQAANGKRWRYPLTIRLIP